MHPDCTLIARTRCRLHASAHHGATPTLSPQVARLDLSRFLESSVASWASEAQATAAQMEGNGNGVAAAEVR